MKYQVVIKVECAQDERDFDDEPLIGTDLLVPFGSLTEVVEYLRMVAAVSRDPELRRYASTIMRAGRRAERGPTTRESQAARARRT